MSQAQANAVLAMLHQAEAGEALSPEDKADLCIRVSAVPWYEHHELPLLDELSSSAGASAYSREPQQVYLSFLEFFTQDNWTKLLEEEPSSDATLNLIIARVIRLGGRNVCEHTKKLMTSLWLFLVEPDLMRLTYWHKKRQFDYLKKEYRRVVERTPRCPVKVKILPVSPEELAMKNPEVYNRAFSAQKGDGPMRCPLDLVKLRALDASYRCRGGGPGRDEASSSSSQLALNSTSGPANAQMELCRQMMVQQAQQMQVMKDPVSHQKMFYMFGMG